MLPTKKTPHTYPTHASAEWIAHNEAMKAKAPLLHGDTKCRYGVMPSIEIHRRSNWSIIKQAVRDVLMVIGAVTVLGLMFSVGVVVGF